MNTEIAAASKQLVEALLDATKRKKLYWVRSPHTDEFLAAIAAQEAKQTYVLRRVAVDDGQILSHLLQIEVSNADTHETLYEIEEPMSGEALELYREVLSRTDKTGERLQESLKLLKSL